MSHPTPIVQSSGSADIVDFDELYRRVDEGDTSCVLLNVLPRAAFEAGRIPGSVNLPLAELSAHAANVLPAREQETIVYCASESCMLARQASIVLRTLGYSRVREYHGGMEEWTERHGRIERAAVPQRTAPAEAAKSFLSRLSPITAFEWVSSQSLTILFSVWLGSCAIFALLYWLAGNTAVSLTSGSARLPRDFASLVTAFGFSIATAMSASYGDVLAAGWMRLAVLGETAAGILIFTALITKILNGSQETVLEEVRRLTYENRLVRLRTNLHFLLSEVAEIAGQCANPAVARRRLQARIESVAAIFAGELDAVRDFVYGHHNTADDAALDGLFACLASGLEDLADLLTCLPEGRERSGALRRSLRTIAQLGDDLCGTCMVGTRPPTLIHNMDRVHRVCRALSDELRPGDLAPAFALEGSDGTVHRLDHHSGKPLVLLWFPKAFTGG